MLYYKHETLFWPEFKRKPCSLIIQSDSEVLVLFDSMGVFTYFEKWLIYLLLVSILAEGIGINMQTVLYAS